MMRCHDGSTYVQTSGRGDHLVKCASCNRLLAIVDGPRDEVFADL
jgi:hypothetical protein